MCNSYQKILKKITDTEKRLKPNKQDISAMMDYEISERNALLKNQDDDVIEEYKSLKENIISSSMDSYSLAYQPVKIKNRKWANEN